MGFEIRSMWFNLGRVLYSTVINGNAQDLLGNLDFDIVCVEVKFK